MSPVGFILTGSVTLLSLLCLPSATTQRSTAIAQDDVAVGRPLAAPPAVLIPAPGQQNTMQRFGLQLMKIKLDEHEDGPRFICMLDRFVEEEQEVKVTFMKVEKKIQTITVQGADGEDETVEREVQVVVPVTENVKRKVKVARGKRPLLIPFDEASLHRLDGTKLTIEEAAEALPTLRTVIIASNPAQASKPAAKLLSDVLNPNTLTFTSDTLNEAIQPQRLPAAGLIQAAPLAAPMAAPVPAIRN
jgi:hypothetical protein